MTTPGLEMDGKNKRMFVGVFKNITQVVLIIKVSMVGICVC